MTPTTSVGDAATLTLRAGGRDVPLLAGPGALARLPSALAERGFAGRLWVVADALADDLHGAELRAVLPDASLLRIGGDEASKTLAQTAAVWDWLLEGGAERRDALVAFGGGVICDLVGFAAACYLRGIGLVNAPTTLLAQVDASVGGKTGVNHPRGKNLIGAFYQPLAVVADTSLLSTLSNRAFGNGMAEIAKIAMALDADLFARLEVEATDLGPSDAARLGPIISRAIELKAGVVERDERESGERMLLNYGHTVGHALEAASSYETLLHGEAVAVGMEVAARIAVSVGSLHPADADRQRRLVEALHLPRRAPAGYTLQDVLSRLSVDKKRVGARQRWVLATRVGEAVVRDDVPAAAVVDAISGVL